MSSIKIFGKRKKIALVAHDHKMADFLEWAVHNKAALAKHELVATGKLMEEALDRPVKKVLSGPLGGDQQIVAMIANGEIDMMFFFWDLMKAQPHDSDVKALLRLCVAWNIPMACDRATADFIMTSPFMHEAYERTLPDYTDYLNRKVKDNE